MLQIDLKPELKFPYVLSAMCIVMENTVRAGDKAYQADFRLSMPLLHTVSRNISGVFRFSKNRPRFSSQKLSTVFIFGPVDETVDVPQFHV